MQQNVKTNIDRAISKIVEAIGGDIVSRGEDRLSMAFLSNSFSSSVFNHVRAIGTRGQLAILADESTHSVSLADADIDARNVETLIASACREVLMARLRPKMEDMCRALNRGRIRQTLEEVASVLERAALENDPVVEHDVLRLSSSFASSVAVGDVPEAHVQSLSTLSSVMHCLADRRRDKALIARLGLPLERLVRLTDRVSDIAKLAELDPDFLAEAVDFESGSPKASVRALAA